jgi:hypothetical protein
VTTGLSREVRENELVKQRVAAAGKAAGYIFFMNVPEKGYAVAIVRVNAVELVFPIP